MGPYAVIPFAGPQPMAQPFYQGGGGGYPQPSYGWGGGGFNNSSLLQLAGPVITAVLMPAALLSTATLADQITFSNSARQAVITGAIVSGIAGLVG